MFLLFLIVSVPTHITQRPEQIPIVCLILLLLPVIYLHIFTTCEKNGAFYEFGADGHLFYLRMVFR